MKWRVMANVIPNGRVIYNVYKPNLKDPHGRKDYADSGSFFDLKQAQNYADRLNMEDEK